MNDIDWDDRVWVVLRMDRADGDDKTEAPAHESVGPAIARAERIVGNRAGACPFPDRSTYLYGPGDGTTSVMVRSIPRAFLPKDCPVVP